jgi:BASS family bile acid:Na+ symporter
MSAHQLVNLLTVVTLFELTFAMGLQLRFSEIAEVARDWRLMFRALLANFVLQPAAAVAVLMVLRPSEFASAAMLLLAACPAALYAMPFTKMAKGRLAVATGLLVVLAASTVVLAPVVLLLLRLFSSSEHTVHVPAGHVILVLLAVVLVPLTLGMGLREWQPELAHRLQKRATRLSMLLNPLMIAAILVTQGHQLEQVRVRGWAGMAIIALASLAIGWLLGGPDRGNRKALAQNTVLRNLGPGLVIATSAFPGSPVAPVIIAATLVNIATGLFAAFWWGRRAKASPGEVAQAGS